MGGETTPIEIPRGTNLGFPILELESDEGGESAHPGCAFYPLILEDEPVVARPSSGRETRNVAVINGNGQPANHANVAVSQLTRDDSVPKYSGKSGEFDDFQWRLERHFGNWEAIHGVELTERVKLMVLERALPDSDRRWLLVLEKQGDTVTYQSVMARLKARAAPTRETHTRQNRNSIAFKTSGKITADEFYKFEVDFTEARQGLPGTSEEECYRHLLAKLPQHLAGWVIDEESRLRCTQPQLLFELPTTYTEASVGHFVQRILSNNPVQTERVAPGEFLVTFLNWTVAKKALELHGKKV